MAKILMVAAAIIMVMKGISAATYTVGDADGWTSPSSPDLYSSWAANHTFVVGDILVFQYRRPFHTVAVVTKDGYDQCEAGTGVVHTDGPTEITLDRPGPIFFICTVTGHCANGQKLAVNVSGTTTMPPSSSQEPQDVGSAPPMPLISIFSSVSFFAFVMALLY